MKRVLIFSLAYLPRHVGGAEIALKEITDRISPDEVEFHMITNRYDSTLPLVERIGNITVHRIGITRKNPRMADLRRFPLHLNKGLYQFLAFFCAVRLHRTHRFDGVWAMMAHATGVPMALFNIFFPNVPYILTLQEGDPPEHIERTMRPLWPLFARSFRKARVVQSISTFLEAWSKRRGASRTTVIPNGVDLHRFAGALGNEEREALRARFNVPHGDTLLVTASRLVAKNGIDTVIETLPTLPAHVHFLVLGEGPERVRLEALARDTGVHDRIRFYGEATQAEIPRLLQASDIFVRASRSEGQGIAFLEAMGAGLPTVGTKVGGIPDFIKDGETGFLANPDDPKDLARVLAGIIEAPERAHSVALRGQALVRSRYSWDQVVADMQARCFSLL
jgi:glycosyltransferase involved in cell wall biosynthesis